MQQNTNPPAQTTDAATSTGGFLQRGCIFKSNFYLWTDPHVSPIFNTQLQNLKIGAI